MTKVKKFDIGAVSFWLIEKPDNNILTEIKTIINLNQSTLTELAEPSNQPKSEEYQDYFYFILHLPIWQKLEKKNKNVEIDLIYAENFLACVSYEETLPLVEFEQELENNTYFRDNLIVANDSFFVFYELLRFVFKFLSRQLHHLQKKVDQVEDKIFTFDLKLLGDFREIKMDVLDFIKIIQQNQRGLIDLDQYKIFAQVDRYLFKKLESDYLKIMDQLIFFQTATNSLEASQLNFLNLQFTKIVRTFTTLAFITFPLMLLVGLVGLGYDSNPLFRLGQSFWLVLGLTLTAAILMIIYFKNKKWL
ncbi:MAG: hypothetical protein M1505_02540 [Patescibacteria group bacterium]|nr:hypothetical protein [Patescibacteria group bacterium]